MSSVIREKSGPDFLEIYGQTVAILPPRERVALDYALRSVTTAFAVANSDLSAGRSEDYPDLPDLPSSHIKAIADGLADEKAGDFRDGNEVLQEMRTKFAVKTGK